MADKSPRKTESQNMLNARMAKRPIAIVGMSALFPDAPNLNQYWDNIINKIDSIIDIPESHWNINDYYDADSEAPDKTYCKRGGFIPDIDFNPIEFGIPPNILEVTDVTQLLGLLVAKSAMEDAGYVDAGNEILDSTGVILGVTAGMKLLGSLTSRLQYPVWEKVLRHSGISENDTKQIIEKIKKAYVPWEENSFPGMLGNVIAGRIANRLNLGGTNCTVDAACASSLSAMKMAISDLLEYRADMMIAGGVDADNSPMMYMCFSKTPAFTSGENPRPFDQDSGGVMIGEGLGMVILKRLEDAQRDGDRVYALIKGIGASSDGKFKSIYAPRSSGQAKALKRAYEDANVEPLSIGLLEAHGTGTDAGDLAEFEGLKEIFNSGKAKNSGFPNYQHIALGSIKSQIGHTKAAAGVAGLIKTALALHHKILPPTINIDRPSDKMEIEKTPFYLNTEPRPWFSKGEPRRAGVSSFGFGGTNFHYVLEEVQTFHSSPYRLHKTPNCVFISAATPEELDKSCQKLIAELETEGAEKRHRQLLESSVKNPIPKTHARLGFVTESIETTLELLGQAVTTLESKADQTEWNAKNIAYREKSMNTKGKVVALFSGQGSQYMNMGKELLYNFPVMTEPFNTLDELFTQSRNKTNSSIEPLSDLVFPIAVFDDQIREEQESRLQLTENAQPAIGAISAGFFRLLRDKGLSVDFAAGHSFGELTALWAAGVIDEVNYYKLAYARGQAMSAPDDPNFDAGSMLAVMGKVEKLEDDIVDFPEVVMANLNSWKQVVLAGPTEDILKVHDALKEKKYTVVKLPVSAAFHTPLVSHAQKPFSKAIREIKFNKAKIPVYSNATAKAYPSSAKAIQKQLETHILNSVRFREEVENIHQDGGRIFIEFGPKNVLTKLVENILSGKDFSAIALNENPKKDSDILFREAMVKLCVLGLPLQNYDSYALPAKELPENTSALSVSLNGTNYVSEATKNSFENTLNDGFEVKNSATSGSKSKPNSSNGNSPDSLSEGDEKMPPEKINQVNPMPTPEEKTLMTEASSIKHQEVKMHHNTPHQSSQAAQYPPNVGNDLSGFFQQQNETLQVHRQYLEHQSEYSRTVYKLMQQQIELASQGTSIPPEVDRQMQLFHTNQNETLRVHEQYLSQQSEQTQSALSIAGQQLGGKGLLSFQTSNTATPLQQLKPQIPKESVLEEPVPLDAPTSTIGTPADEPVSSPVPNNEIMTKTAVPETISPSLAVSGNTAESVMEIMMAVVSEKTGYPQEMLELGMDIESDLGIDSIKRVEILGSVQDRAPELNEIPADELAEMRTLGQIIEYLQKSSKKLQTQKFESKKPPEKVTDTGISQETESVHVNDITSALMEIVSEKTGYPQQMLEPEMDMESDLGIDSIKRVEILGTAQENIPSLPEIPAEELAELRTLGQIIEHLNKTLGESTTTKQNDVSTFTSSQNVFETAVQDPEQIFLSIISEKTGYPTEMLELSMDMEADLGIDSIKRVEIMWSLQENLQDLPQIGANDIAELRTVGQIIDYIKSVLPDRTKGAPSSKTVILEEDENSSSIMDSSSSGNGEGSMKEAPVQVTGEIAPALLSIIGEKTGYPPEMLDLNMDMEADLGIDSIKRVEIMWSLQEQLPHLPQVSGSEMSELRTLKEIADHLGTLAPSDVNDSPIIAKSSDNPAPVKKKS